MSTGCGCKEIYRFPHNILIPTLLLYLLLFAAATLLFVHVKKMFFVLVPLRFCNKILCIKHFFPTCSINTHTGNYGRPTAAI